MFCMKKIQNKNLKIQILIYTLFFLGFLYISRYAVVAGDDWGYAVGGREANALYRASQNYMHWSGRFLSELWGYSIAPHKKLWNFLNAGIFTGILYFLMKIVSEMRHKWVTYGLCILLMLSVHDGVRMQTYTWMMGTTYVIPLLLFLIYLYIVQQYVLRNVQSKKMKVVGCFLNLCIPLYMENAAAMLFGVNLLILLYLQFHDQRKRKMILVFTIYSFIGLLLIRYSPGAMYRMNRDHVTFNSLSLFEKISLNWMNFLNWTFINHQVLMRTMSLALLYVVSKKKKRFTWFKYEWLVVCFVIAIPLVQTNAYHLFEVTKINAFYILFDLNLPHSMEVNTFLYTLFTIGLFRIAFVMEDETKWTCLLCLFAAGGASAVMLISPIYDARSSLYTIYMFILYLLVIVKEVKFTSVEGNVLTIVLFECHVWFTLHAFVSKDSCD